MRPPSTTPVLINDLELLHGGLGVLIAHYLACHDGAVRHCLALRISRQLRIIAEHRDLPDWALRPLSRTMAARWHGGAIHGLPCPRQPANPHPTSEETRLGGGRMSEVVSMGSPWDLAPPGNGCAPRSGECAPARLPGTSARARWNSWRAPGAQAPCVSIQFRRARRRPLVARFSGSWFASAGCGSLLPCEVSGQSCQDIRH